MKDTVITSKRKKTEIITILICFLIANIANLYSIITYNTSYLELITSMGYVAVAAAVVYVIWSVIRIIIYGIKLLLIKKEK